MRREGEVGKMTCERERISKWIEGEGFVVRVEAEATFPNAWPWKPQLEPAAIKFLDRVQELANRGEIGELEKLGEVYVRRAG
jgi:hypothetical protein